MNRVILKLLGWLKLTFAIFIILLVSACENEQKISAIPYIIDKQEGCELLPKFTLGYESKPNSKEVENLCLCIMGSLSNNDIVTAVLISTEESVSQNDIEKFSSAFGGSVMACGGDKIGKN